MYSQHNEDDYLEKHLPEKCTYVDVGASNGVLISNTYAFYKKGGHGVCIDPIPANCDNMRRVRPLDQIVCCAVGHAGYGDLYVMPCTDLSSLTPQTGSMYTMVVETRTLSDIISESGLKHIDLLDVDTEGTEYHVLVNYDFKIKPTYILVEHDGNAEYKHALNGLLESHGYKFIRDFGGVNGLWRFTNV